MITIWTSNSALWSSVKTLVASSALLMLRWTWWTAKPSQPLECSWQLPLPLWCSLFLHRFESHICQQQKQQQKQQPYKKYNVPTNCPSCCHGLGVCTGCCCLLLVVYDPNNYRLHCLVWLLLTCYPWNVVEWDDQAHCEPPAFDVVVFVVLHQWLLYIFSWNVAGWDNQVHSGLLAHWPGQERKEKSLWGNQ